MLNGIKNISIIRYNQFLPSDGQRNVRIKSGSVSSNSKQICIASDIKFCKNDIT